MKGKRKILLVGGDAEETRSLQGMLAPERYQFFFSTRGGEALETVCEVRPDLVILDARIPEMSGLDVCRRMKNQPDTRQVPVLVTSERNGREERIAALSAGADDFLHKPVDPEEFGIRVGSLIRLKEYADDLEKSCREIARKNELMTELEGAREELAHMIIHDMTNSLSAVTLGIESVLDERESLSERQAKILEICLVNGREHMALIDNILDVYRMESREIVLAKKKVSVADLIDQVLLMFRHRIEAKRIALVRPEGSGLPPMRIDPGLMKRVLANLVSNAIRHTPREGRIEIDVRPTGHRGDYMVSVTDNGTGMEPAYFQKVFDKFEQVEMKRAGVIRGTIGLGLAFCKLVVEAHGGWIWVESQGIGTGCSFRFVVPGALIHREPGL